MTSPSTLSVKTFEGIPCIIRNILTDTKHTHYISYNNIDTITYGSDTTAIVLKVGYHISKSRKYVTYYDDCFLILNGKHDKELKDKDFFECLTYFIANSHLKNKYSEDVYNYLYYRPISKRSNTGSVL